MHTFCDIIGKLCNRLAIEIPNLLPEIITLQVGERMMHLTEHPSNFLLMFCCIDYGLVNESNVFLRLNVFSLNTLQPIISRDEKTNDLVLWNRQILESITIDSAYEQLQFLSDTADRLVLGEFI